MMTRIKKAQQGQSRRRMAAATVLALLLTGLFSLHALAEPVIARAYAYEGNPLVWFVKGLDGELSGEGQGTAAAVIGEQPCLVEAGSIRNAQMVHFRTVIMLDNSASISELNRKKALELIQRVIQNHAEGEEFVIYTFSTELTKVAEGTDYASLSSAAAGIQFQNQDAYLIDCLVSVLDSLGQEQSFNYNRVILISDGVDDNKEGNTYFDLQDRLENDATRCPVYTVASVWEKDTSGMKNLQKISEIAGAQPFVLDETEDLSQITNVLAEDYAAKMFAIYTPLQEKDGQKKTVHLSVATTAGQAELEHEVSMPQRTQEEEQELQAQQESEAAAEQLVTAAAEAIGAIHDPVTAEDGEAIKAAEEALAQIGEDETMLAWLKQLLGGAYEEAQPAEIVAKAREELDALAAREGENEAKVSAAREAIKAIPDPVSAGDEDKIKAAEDAVGALGGDQELLSMLQGQLEGYNGESPEMIVARAREAYTAAAEQKAENDKKIAEVKAAIKAIPDPVSAGDGEKVRAAQAALAEIEDDEALMEQLEEELGEDPAAVVEQAAKDWEEANNTVVVDVPESETQAEEVEEPSFFDEYRYIIFGGAGVLLAGLILLVVLLVRRRRARMWDDGGYVQHPDKLLDLEGQGKTVADENLWAGNSLKGKEGGGEGSFGPGGGSFGPGAGYGQTASLGNEETQDEFGGGDPETKGKTVGMWGTEASANYGKLIVLTDVRNPGKRYEARLRDEFVIGRDSLCTVVISDDRTVSANHCRLLLLNGSVLAEDLHSRNGTSINGNRIAGAAPLHSGDELKLGASRLRVEIQ